MEPAQRRTRTAPGALAAFARFVLCGGGVGLASGAAVAGCAAFMPWALANAGVTAASTLLATELHARFTFGGGRRSTLRQHVQSAGSAAAAYAVTCTAMAVLHLLATAPGLLLEQFVYLSASALAGIGRFAVLRLAVFPARRPAAAAPKRLRAVRGAGAPAPASPAPAPATGAASATASLWYRTLAAASPLPAVCHAA